MTEVETVSGSGDDVQLARRSAGGVVWNGVTFGASKLLVLATTVVLARLLTPEDFGLVGIGLLMISYLDLVNDFGVNAAVIQRRDDPERTADVAFWINMALGVTLTAAGIAAAPVVADFFGESRATAVIRVLSLTLLITSVGAIHEARLRRELQFSKRLIPELGRAVIKGGTAIVLATLGFGVWSLVWAQVAGELFAAAAYWVAMPWRPKPIFDRVIGRKLLGFGSHITAVGILGTVVRNVDYIVVGRVLGARQLGLYTLAFRMPQLLIEGAVTIVGQVGFPAFARVQAQPERLRNGLLKGLRLTTVVIAPLALGLALVADPFVRTVYGGRWTSAIEVMRLLALYMLVQGATRLCGDVYKAIGRARLLSRLALLKLIVTVPLLIAAVDHGIVAVAGAQLVAAVICTSLDLVVVCRVVKVDAGQLLRAYRPALVAGSAMVGACWLAAWLAGSARPVFELAIVTVVGGVSYLTALRRFERATSDELLTLLRRGGGRSQVADGLQPHTPTIGPA